MLKQLALAPGRVMADVQSSALVNSHESATRSSAMSKLQSPYSKTRGGGKKMCFFQLVPCLAKEDLKPFSMTSLGDFLWKRNIIYLIYLIVNSNNFNSFLFIIETLYHTGLHFGLWK